MYNTRTRSNRCTGFNPEIRDALQPFLQEDAQLGRCERGTRTTVDALPKGGMRPGIAAAEIHFKRILEAFGIQSMQAGG